MKKNNTWTRRIVWMIVSVWFFAADVVSSAWASESTPGDELDNHDAIENTPRSDCFIDWRIASETIAKSRYRTAETPTEGCVKNIRARQREGTLLVDVYYDLVGEEGATYSVGLQMETNGSEIAVSSVSGAIGEQIPPGTDWHIVWDAGMDWPDNVTETMVPVIAAGRNGVGVDLVFVVDTTGSMSGLATYQTLMKGIIDEQIENNSATRIGVVAYRDFPEHTGNASDYAAKLCCKLTSNRSQAKAAISALSAEGGGDGPESLFSALALAAEQFPNSGARTKRILVVTDAPPHDPEPYTGYTTASVASLLEERGISVHFYGYSCSSYTTIANVTGGDYSCPVPV